MTCISIFLPDLRIGGAEKITINIANCLVSRGYVVDLVLLSAAGELIGKVDDRINIFDLKVKKIRTAFFPLVKYIQQRRPTTLLAVMWPLTTIVILARLYSRLHFRVVVAEHTTWSRSELLQRPTVGWQVRTSMRHFFPKADGIVAVSKGAADDLASFAQLPRESISVIYNPVVAESLTPPRDRPVEPNGWCSASRRILAVGTLKTIKDYATLLSAFELLLQYVDACLLILGEGECRRSLEEQAKQLGIADKVFLPGFVKDTEPYYQHASLHVLSSTGEGLPTVIIEALAAGTPVVSTDCPSGPREILCDGKYGRLVPVGDASALAHAMEKALTSDHDRVALMARAQDFSIDKAVDQYETLLFPHLSSGLVK
jgi:glycosyltransferase involved in cell wall biosynthesis